MAPDGRDTNPGTRAAPLRTVGAAIAKAAPGAVIDVAAGTYSEALSTSVSGATGAPITLRGHGAVLTGDTDRSGRVLQIRNDYWTIKGFEITGADNGVWIEGGHHVVVASNEIHHLLGECVRVKYLSADIVIERNSIHNCGLEDFVQNPGSGKNGEGVYIGTAPEQLGKNPAPVPDATTRVVVRDNVIVTHGNECVDIKEAATGNVVEFNDCSEQRDPESGGFDSRGSGNVFRYNRSHDNTGAGIRVGGDEVTDGTGNDLIGNELSDNEGSGIKVMRLPQGTVCGNAIERSGRDAINTDEVTNPSCRERHPSAGPRYSTPGRTSP
ncbi:MAG: right-handed parallel beta-helix repeat-containing protein [Acidimicrobiia bacterium]